MRFQKPTAFEPKQLLSRPLTASELNKLKRYASWMRRLAIREWNLSPDITQLIVPVMRNVDPVLRFTLQGLNWWLNWTNLSFLTSFLSPQLTSINIRTDTSGSLIETVDPWIGEVPTEVLPVMRSAIKMFPPSLRYLSVYMGNGREARLTEDISTYMTSRTCASGPPSKNHHGSRI